MSVYRLLGILVLYGIVLLADRREWSAPSAKHDRLCYALILAISLYVGFDYVTGLNLPGLYELSDWTIGPAARAIVKWLQPTLR